MIPDTPDEFAEMVFGLMLRICIVILVLFVHSLLLSTFSRWTFTPIFGLPEAGFRECAGFLLSIRVCTWWIHREVTDAA